MKRRGFVLVNRVMNGIVARLRPKRFRGADLLLLTTTGRTSGKPRTTPLIYMPDRGRWIVVASNGGADWEPGWWLNLRAGSPASIDVAGTVTSVTGTEITGDERAVMWQTLNDTVFDYQAYQDKVSRTIAVVALSPTPAP
ncbi:nitroreductase/quinone reductase family protein [Gordonia sp. PKS22-38]|uniref:Nitroreductase/quinone reductase family protein n=1 Tax=Gordonia prachuapensis TaxID=3115651 RepID=A0ABU7MQH9_9ACTN|nr:nitroreductase/quinone reductase family protein [Gordonia sp. PKS22-38]